MALRAFSNIRALTKALTYYYISCSQRHLLAAIENNRFGVPIRLMKVNIYRCLFVTMTPMLLIHVIYWCRRKLSFPLYIYDFLKVNWFLMDRSLFDPYFLWFYWQTKRKRDLFMAKVSLQKEEDTYLLHLLAFFLYYFHSSRRTTSGNTLKDHSEFSHQS